MIYEEDDFFFPLLSLFLLYPRDSIFDDFISTYMFAATRVQCEGEVCRFMVILNVDYLYLYL